MRISDWSSDVCSSDLVRRIVYRALSKSEVFEAFASAPQDLRLLDHHPPARVLDRDTPSLSTADAACLGATLYLKADARHGPPGGDDLLCGPLRSAEAAPAVREALGRYRKVLLQGPVTGRQARVSLLMGARGEVLASNCFVHCHLEPTRRAPISLSRTWTHPCLLPADLRR